MIPVDRIAHDEPPLFRFVVITDTHMTAVWDETTSPYPSGKQNNRRTAAAVARVKSLKPAFVLHLGDMVHPVPGQPGFHTAAEQFHKVWSNLGVPLYVIPGNHDVGDKPSGWLPAPMISPQALAAYEKAFGADRCAFDHGGCRFVMANASLINSGLPEEDIQWAWLDSQIPYEQRSFLALHYPPFLLATDEPDHYDNLANPGRARLLSLIKHRPVEAIFTGHVHNVFLSRLDQTDLHVLPAISFIRSDYANLFPVPPPDTEFGRNHVAHLGFLLVEVFARGYTAHWVHTFGGTEPDAAIQEMPVSMLHPRRLVAPIGVDLRQEWARPLSIPYAGGVDELSRKYVRNDYLTMRMQSLGLRMLRVPLQDVIDPVAAQRMRELAAMGHRFVVFSYGLPAEDVLTRIASLSPAVAILELIDAAERYAAGPDRLASIARSIDVSIMISKLNVSAETEGGSNAKTYTHFIRHGYIAETADAAYVELQERHPGLDGLCFRIDRAEPLWPALEAIAASARRFGKRALVHIRLVGTNVSTMAGTLAETANRLAEATLGGWAFADVLTLIVDTFVDMDRGYFPRTGLITASCDLNPAGAVVQKLAELLSQEPDGGQVAVHGTTRSFQVAGEEFVLSLFPQGSRPPSGDTGIAVDLFGSMSPHRSASPGVEWNQMPRLSRRRAVIRSSS